MAELDGGADSAVHISSCIPQLRFVVVVSGHHVVVDIDAIDLANLLLDVGLLGMEEGVANVLELSDIIGAEFSTALHVGGELGEEIAELFDAFVHLVDGAIVEASRGVVDVSDEGVIILDACRKFIVINALNLSSSEDTGNQRSRVRSRDAISVSVIAFNTSGLWGTVFITAVLRLVRKWSKGCSHIIATNTSGISRKCSTAIVRVGIILGKDCCSNKG